MDINTNVTSLKLEKPGVVVLTINPALRRLHTIMNSRPA